MCGIAGIISFKNEIKNPDLILKMTGMLKHRGPDDEGYVSLELGIGKVSCWYGKDTLENVRGRDFLYSPKNPVDEESFKAARLKAIFGHRRLSILDLSPLGHQPMCNEDGTVWIVYNGEIYNDTELREFLEGEGHRFISRSDTEVVIHAYEEWGKGCVNRFNGMWAFVILDLEKRELFCSRDRTGVKPFYYVMENDSLAFASEIKPLNLLVRHEPEEGVVWDYLVLRRVNQNEETFFRNIKELMPGHNMHIGFDGRVATNIYWAGETDLISGKVLSAEEVRELIEEAVRLRLRSDVPVGSCLSGGLDSSTIVSIVNRTLKSSSGAVAVGTIQKTFTSTFEDLHYDERKFVDILRRNIELDCKFVFPSAEGFEKEIDDLVKVQEEPFGSTSIYAQYCIMKKVRDEKVKVLLDGQGGDELFGGYENYSVTYLLELLAGMEFSTFWKEIASAKAADGPGFGKRFLLILRELLKTTALPQAIVFSKNAIIEHRVIDGDFFNTYIPRARVEMERLRKTAFSLNRKLDSDLRGGQLRALLRYEDRNSMAFSVEARTPFADDLPLIESVMKLPPEAKIRNGWQKYVLREAVVKLLPDEIRWRKDKMGFVTPEWQWINKLILSRKTELLESNCPFISRENLEKEIAKLQDGYPERKGTSPLWRAVNIILWHKFFWS